MAKWASHGKFSANTKDECQQAVLFISFGEVAEWSKRLPSKELKEVTAVKGLNPSLSFQRSSLTFLFLFKSTGTHRFLRI